MSRSRWEPTWRRLLATAAVLFAVIFAFLAGRVRAGADPGLASRATATRTQSHPDTVTPPEQQTPSQPYEQQQPDFGAPQDADPPSTHVS
jgi:hypothetical protein